MYPVRFKSGWPFATLCVASHCQKSRKRKCQVINQKHLLDSDTQISFFLFPRMHIVRAYAS